MKIVSRAEWGALPARSKAGIRSVNHFIVHHTTGDHRGRDDSANWVRAIQRFHMNSRQWADIAYSFLIDKNGVIFEGRGWDVSGAHTRGHNSSSIGVAFLGDGTLDVPDAVFTSLQDLYEEACSRYGSDIPVVGHKDLGATACPGGVLYDWVKGGGYRAPSGTPIVTAVDTVSRARAQQWARNNSAADLFVDEIIPALYDAARSARRENGGVGPDAAVLVAQSAKETGWGRFTGVLTPAFRNTAGIKTRSGGGDFDPEAHQRFLTWADGARAHANHLAAYTGQRPVGMPHGRYYTVMTLSWAGTIRTVEQLGARWAPNAAYGVDIVRMLADLVKVPEPAAPAPAPAPVQKDPVLRVGSRGPEVAQVQAWLFADGVFGTGTFEAVRAFQRRQGLVADGVVGPLTWAKLKEVYR